MQSELVWLAADYHFPYPYSCRVPNTCLSSSLAMPGPGPATVRLALIRVSIELFGIEHTHHALFPIIRSMTIRVRPPEQVAISVQQLRIYKAREGLAGKPESLTESIGYRETAQTTGLMTLHIKIPAAHEAEFAQVLQEVGYWGQANSFAVCIRTRQAHPVDGESAIQLSEIQPGKTIWNFFACFATEFQSPGIEWEEIMPDGSGEKDVLRNSIFIWPLEVCERHDGGKLLRYRSLISNSADRRQGHNDPD